MDKNTAQKTMEVIIYSCPNFSKFLLSNMVTADIALVCLACPEFTQASGHFVFLLFSIKNLYFL